MVITKEDLLDWNSNPVTQEIFKRVAASKQDVLEESCIRDTIDQTVIQTARNEGQVEGINAIEDAYNEALEDSK